MADARTLLNGVFTVTGSRIIGLFLTLLQIKLTVNHLQPSGYGLLTTATLFIAAFGAWTELGLGSIVVRRVSGAGQDLEKTVGWVMSISLVLMAPLLVAVNLTGWFLYQAEPRVVLGIAILSLGLAATSWSSCYTPVAQVKNKFLVYAAADVGSRMLSLSVVVFAFLNNGSIAWFFVAALMPSIVKLVCMELWGRRVGRFRPEWDRTEMLRLVRETLPMTYIFLVAVLYFTIDGILLSKLSTLEQVGSYGLSYKIAGNLTVVGQAAAAVMSARFAADAAESSADFASTLRSTLRLMLLIAFPVAMFIGPLSPDVIRFVGSEDMVQLAARPLAIICVAVAIGMVLMVITVALLNAHMQSFLAKFSTANLGLNIILNVILIPHWGAVGAAVALVVSEVSGLVCCLILLARRYPGSLPLGSAFVMFVCAVAGLGAELLFHDVPWVLKAMLAFVIFLVFTLLLRAVSVSELRHVLPRRWRTRATG